MGNLFKSVKWKYARRWRDIRKKRAALPANEVRLLGRAKKALTGSAGEGYIDTVIMILIYVVLGALLLAGLYALFGDVIMPKLSQEIQGFFDYNG